MLFNQRIGLIEATEELKRVNVDTKTFTQPKTHVYTDTSYYIRPIGDPDSEAGVSGSVNNFATYVDRSRDPSTAQETNIANISYANIYAVGSVLPIKALCFWVQNATTSNSLTQSKTTIKLTTPGGSVITIGDTNSNTGDVISQYTLATKGEYVLEYSGDCGLNSIGVSPEQGAVTYTFSAVEDVVLKPRKTITEVINTVLNYACGNRNRYYVLDPVYAKKWTDIVAPEFYFTRNTLYEVLLQIGGYRDIQAIPRLEWLEPPDGVAPYTESISFCLTFFCLQRIILIKVDVPLRGVRKRQRHLKLLDL